MDWTGSTVDHLTSIYHSFEQWLDRAIIGWIRLIYSTSNFDSDDSTFDQYLSNYKKQLAHFMYTYYAKSRINRLFDIVIDYPDSKNAIEDLKICLQKTNLRANVIKSLKSSIEQRLLHPGVGTCDIMSVLNTLKISKSCWKREFSSICKRGVCECNQGSYDVGHEWRHDGKRMWATEAIFEVCAQWVSIGLQAVISIL